MLVEQHISTQPLFLEKCIHDFEGALGTDEKHLACWENRDCRHIEGHEGLHQSTGMMRQGFQKLLLQEFCPVSGLHDQTALASEGTEWGEEQEEIKSDVHACVSVCSCMLAPPQMAGLVCTKQLHTVLWLDGTVGRHTLVIVEQEQCHSFHQPTEREMASRLWVDTNSQQTKPYPPSGRRERVTSVLTKAAY